MSDPENAVTLAQQRSYLQGGGSAQAAVAKLPGYVFNEYPKAIRTNVREEQYEELVYDIKDRELRSKMTRTVWDEVIAQNEDDEARITGGQPTAAAAEDERQDLLRHAEARGLKVDRRWGAERIRAAMDHA